MRSLRPTIFIAFAMLSLAGTAAADATRGVVTVAYDGKPQGVHPVAIQEIDGKQQPLPLRETHFLEPGKHTFRLAPAFDDSAKVQRGNIHRRGDDSEALLEIDVQAGKRYVIGAKVEDRKAAEWKPVVLRVEDAKP